MVKNDILMYLQCQTTFPWKTVYSKAGPIDEKNENIEFSKVKPDNYIIKLKSYKHWSTHDVTPDKDHANIPKSPDK